MCGGILPPIKKKRVEKAMSNDKKQNLQDTFLNSVRKTRTPLTIFLVNGVKLQGVVSWFDNFSCPAKAMSASEIKYQLIRTPCLL